MILGTVRHRGTEPFPNEVSIEFSALPELLVIRGPNGSGKTTLLDVIAAMRTLEFPYRTGPLHRHFQEKGFIEGTWWDAPGGQGYRVRINVDPEAEKTEATLWKIEGGPALAGPLQKSFLAKMRELLGPTDRYLASAYSVQQSRSNKDSGFSFLLADRTARRAIFADMLGLARYKMREAMARDKMRGLETKLTGLRAQAEQLEAHASRIPTLAQVAEAAAAKVRTAQEAADQAQIDLVSAQAGLSAAQERRATIEPARGRLSPLEAEIGALEARRLDVLRRRAAAEGILAKAPEVEAAHTRLIVVRSEIAALVPAEAERARALREIPGIENRLASTRRQQEGDSRLLARAGAIRAAVTRTAEIADLLTAYEADLVREEALVQAASQARHAWELKGQQLQLVARALEQDVRAAELMENVPCRGEGLYADCQFLLDAAAARRRVPNGEAAVAAAIRDRGEEPALPQTAEVQRLITACAALRAEDQRLRSQVQEEPLLRAAEERQESLAEASAADVALLAAKLEEITRYSSALQTLLNLRDEEATLQPVAVRYSALAGARATLEENRIQLEPIEQELAVKQVERAGLLKQLGELQTLERAVQEAHHGVAQAEGRIREAAGILSGVTREQGVADGSLAAAQTAQAQAATARAETTPLLDELDDWTLLARFASPTGVPALKVDEALPEVSRLASDLLSECLGESLFAIKFISQKDKADGSGQREVLDIVIHRGEKTQPAETLSGGEGVLVSEAISVAIALFTAARSGQREYTLMRDEVGASLDVENNRSAQYVTMLRRAAKLGGFRQVLLVSHEPTCLALADAQLHVRGGKVTIE